MTFHYGGRAARFRQHKFCYPLAWEAAFLSLLLEIIDGAARTVRK